MTRADAIKKAKALANDQQRAYQVLQHKWRTDSPIRIEFAGQPYAISWRLIGVYMPKAPITDSQQLALSLAPKMVSKELT